MNLDLRYARLEEIYQGSVCYGGGRSSLDGHEANRAKGQEVSRRQNL